jgi:hypothetical protein
MCRAGVAAALHYASMTVILSTGRLWKSGGRIARFRRGIKALRGFARMLRERAGAPGLSIHDHTI